MSRTVCILLFVVAVNSQAMTATGGHLNCNRDRDYLVGTLPDGLRPLSLKLEVGDKDVQLLQKGGAASAAGKQVLVDLRKSKPFGEDYQMDAVAVKPAKGQLKISMLDGTMVTTKPGDTSQYFFEAKIEFHVPEVSAKAQTWKRATCIWTRPKP